MRQCARTPVEESALYLFSRSSISPILKVKRNGERGSRDDLSIKSRMCRVDGEFEYTYGTFCSDKDREAMSAGSIIVSSVATAPSKRRVSESKIYDIEVYRRT